MPNMPLRRSARLAALHERRRESEENALRQQRERIAQTHRHVARNGAGPSSMTMRSPTPPTHSRTRPRGSSGFDSRARTSAPLNDTERPRLVRQYAIRGRRAGIMANPQLTTRATNTNVTGRLASSSGRFPTRAMRTTGSSALINSRNDNRPLFLYDTQELRESVFNIGLILGNRYSSDSEDSYFQPRVIDPDAISEDESDEESHQVRELTPAPEPAAPAHRPVTRSMSSRPTFYDDPAPSTVLRRPAPTIKKKAAKKSMCKCKAGTSSVKSVIKVEKLEPCTICYEDEPKKPVACTNCRQTVGCRHCVKKWFLTTNMSHLDQRTPYPIGGTDRNHKRCPLCRADWPDTPQVVPVVCKDVFGQQPQSSTIKPSSDVIMK